MMGGNMGGDSDDEEEECQVEPHLPEDGQDKKLNADIDDLDGEETSDLKWKHWSITKSISTMINKKPKFDFIII